MYRNNHSRKLIFAGLFAFALIGAADRPAFAQATHVYNDWAQFKSDYKDASLRDYLTRLKTALADANKLPEINEPLKLTAHVTAESRTGVRRLRIRGFQFLSDGAPGAGEYNLGAGSWPSLVGVLGGAVTQDYLTQAALKGIPIDDLEVIFTSTPSAGISPRTGRSVTYPRNLQYTAYIQSPATDAQLEDLRQVVERESTVLHLVTKGLRVPSATLVYTQTPKDRGNALPGLREYLEAKRGGRGGGRQGAPSPQGTGAAQPTTPGAQPTAFQVVPPAVEAPAAPAQPAAQQPGGRGGRGGRNAGQQTGEPPLRSDTRVEGSTGIRHIRTDDYNFQFIHDNPPYLAGHNLGPVAEEHIIGVMMTCLTHIFENTAASQGVDLDSLELEVEGTLDHHVGSSQSPRFTDIHYKAIIGSPESKETVEALVDRVEGICPIYNLVNDSQPVTGKIVRGAYKAPLRTASAK